MTVWLVVGLVGVLLVPVLMAFYSTRTRTVSFSMPGDFGKVTESSCYRGRKRHRDDGPATVRRLEDGRVVNERWYRNGVLHRVEGPAVIDYRLDGSIEWFIYFFEGRIHRVGGPSSGRCDSTGKVIGPGYRMLDEEVSTEKAACAYAELLASTPDRVEMLIRASPYAVLLDEGASSRGIVRALAGGVTTVEGIREVLGGAPVEWVTAFEESGR